MTTSPEAPRPLRKDAARNRALLIQAAREVFAERGLEASLDDVAKHAGVGVGTAYRHFANKYELAEAIFAEAIERIVALAHAARDAADPWEGVISFLEGIASAQTVDRGLREVLMGVHDPSKIEDVNARITPALAELVERAKKAGVVRADLDSTDLGMVVLMLCTVADVMGDAAPDLWRRYLPMLTEGLRSDTVLPVPPVTEDVFHKALSSHKECTIRARSD